SLLGSNVLYNSSTIFNELELLDVLARCSKSTKVVNTTMIRRKIMRDQIGWRKVKGATHYKI
ncbi:hypothetical protein CR513_55201, partial [Mucuna pruriens]